MCGGWCAASHKSLNTSLVLGFSLFVANTKLAGNIDLPQLHNKKIDGRRRYPRKAISSFHVHITGEDAKGSIVTLLILILSTIGIECISPSSSSVHHDKLEGGDGHEVVAGSLHHSTTPSIVVRRHHHVRVLVGEEVTSMVNSPHDLGLGNGKPNPSQEPNLESGMCQTQHLQCH